MCVCEWLCVCICVCMCVCMVCVYVCGCVYVYPFSVHADMHVWLRSRLVSRWWACVVVEIVPYIVVCRQEHNSPWVLITHINKHTLILVHKINLKKHKTYTSISISAGHLRSIQIRR